MWDIILYWGLMVDGFVQALSKWRSFRSVAVFYLEMEGCTGRAALDTVLWVPAFCTLLEGIGSQSCGKGAVLQIRVLESEFGFFDIQPEERSIGHLR